VFVLGFILVSMALMIAILVGLGTLLFERDPASDLTIFDYAISGILIVGLIGLLSNFFVPIDRGISDLTALAGLTAAVINRRQIWCSLQGRLTLSLSLMGALLGMCTIGVVVTPMHFDTGLYHLQEIEWLEQSTKVLGLANLHYRFGFNSLWFTIATMADVVRSSHLEIFLVDAVLFIVVIGALANSNYPVKRNYPIGFSLVFAATLVVVLLTTIQTTVFSVIFASPSYDLPASLMTMYAFYAYFRTLEGREPNMRYLMCLLGASGMAVMIKLSSAPILLLIPMSLCQLARLGDWRFIAVLQSRFVVSLAGLAIIWIASGVLSSGCIAFPIAMTCMPDLAWAVSVADVQSLELIIKAWARMPTEHFMDAVTGWSWVTSWPATMLAYRAFVPAWTMAFAIALMAGVAIGLCDRLLPAMRPTGSRSEPQHHRRTTLKSIGLAVLVSCIGNLFWIIAAPDPRFGAGFLIVLPALVTAAITWRLSSSGLALSFICSGPVFACMVAAVASAFALGQWSTARGSVSSWPQIPVITTKERQFGPQFRANVPVSGQQCWDAPRPCVPGGGAGAQSIRETDWLLWHVYMNAAVP
jgi:hypothetical protein